MDGIYGMGATNSFFESKLFFISIEVLSKFVYETVFKTLDKIGLIAIPLKSSYVTAITNAVSHYLTLYRSNC